MINNLKLIKPLLKFESERDFIQVMILKRKKDQSTDQSNHQSVRTIKSYSFYSVEHLESKMEEIILLSETFKARAYININTKNDSKIALLMIKELCNSIENDTNNLKYVYDRCVGMIHSNQKRWIVDIDSKDEKNIVSNIIRIIDECTPINRDKILAKIPTLNGFHLITSPFHIEEFNKQCHLKIDIQKNNPTILYIPNSITDEQK